jgi:hypothetical protein
VADLAKYLAAALGLGSDAPAAASSGGRTAPAGAAASAVSSSSGGTGPGASVAGGGGGGGPSYVLRSLIRSQSGGELSGWGGRQGGALDGWTDEPGGGGQFGFGGHPPAVLGGDAHHHHHALPAQQHAGSGAPVGGGPRSASDRERERTERYERSVRERAEATGGRQQQWGRRHH